MANALPTAAELVERYGPVVSSLCWRMTRDPEKAREAAQQVWVEVLAGLAGFEGRSELSTWIFGLAWRAVRRFTRDERRYSVRFLREYFSGPELPGPEGNAPDRRVWVQSMCDKCLAGTLQCLEPEARLAYLLRDVAELEYTQIAQVLEVEEPAARQMISRARRKLNGFLQGQCALANPRGECRCRIKRHVQAVDLPAEYERLRRSMRLVRLYQESERALPAKNFWLERA